MVLCVASLFAVAIVCYEVVTGTRPNCSERPVEPLCAFPTSLEIYVSIEGMKAACFLDTST